MPSNLARAGSLVCSTSIALGHVHSQLHPTGLQVPGWTLDNVRVSFSHFETFRVIVVVMPFVRIAPCADFWMIMTWEWTRIYRLSWECILATRIADFRIIRIHFWTLFVANHCIVAKIFVSTPGWFWWFSARFSCVGVFESQTLIGRFWIMSLRDSASCGDNNCNRHFSRKFANRVSLIVANSDRETVRPRIGTFFHTSYGSFFLSPVLNFDAYAFQFLVNTTSLPVWLCVGWSTRLVGLPPTQNQILWWIAVW